MKLELRSSALDSVTFACLGGEPQLLLWLMSGNRSCHWLVGSLGLSCPYGVTVSGEVT